MQKKKLSIKKHVLIPKHIKLSEKEKRDFFKKYNVSIHSLPKINRDDVGIAHLKVKYGDVIKIIRKSPTAGESVFYRGVSSE